MRRQEREKPRGFGASLHPIWSLRQAERLGVKREDCLYIGDSEVDLQTAKNAGMDCISVCWGFRDADFLKQAGATQLVHTPKELEKLLLGESDNLEHKNKR